MCRASGRRCPNAGGRSTQNTRQAVSRAKTALSNAKKTGDPDQITAARDRLTAVRAAHQDAKNATTARDTAAQHGDVTDHHQPTTKDTGMDHQDHQDDNARDDHRQHTSFTITNSVTGNATVGSQHDVHHGNYSRYSTVTNIVNGTNHGIQADIVGDVTIVNGRIRAGHGGDVTDSMARADEHMRQIREDAARARDMATSSGTTPHGDHTDHDESSPAGRVTITDGAGHTYIQAGRVHGEIRINGRRVH